MAITIVKPLSKRPGVSLATTAAIIALSFSPCGKAAEWRIVPTLDLRETYSDNVRLAPGGSEESSFITDVSPGIVITRNGPGLKLKANYVFQHLSYASDREGSRSFQKLDGTANAELVENLFFIDGLAAINQQDIGVLGPSTSDNFAISPNRATVRTVSLSPYLRHEFRGMASGELRYTRTQVHTSSATLSSSQVDGVRLSVTSDPAAFRTLGWGLRYDAQRTDQSDATTIDSATTSADVRYMVTPQFYLTAMAGYDKFDFAVAPNASNPDGAFYTAGFSWHPTERTSLAASAGRRFSGTTFSLNSSVRSRNAVLRLSYDETVTTTPAQFALGTTDSTADLLNQLFRSSITDDALRQQAVDRFIANAQLPASLSRSINFLTNELFLQRALRASVAMSGAKNTVLLTISGTTRQPQSAVDPNVPLTVPGIAAATGDTRQVGANALWSWKFATRTSANFSADYTRKKLDTSDTEDRIKTYRIALARQIQPKLAGIVEFKHADQASDIAANNFHENAISAFLSMKF